MKEECRYDHTTKPDKLALGAYVFLLQLYCIIVTGKLVCAMLPVLMEG